MTEKVEIVKDIQCVYLCACMHLSISAPPSPTVSLGWYREWISSGPERQHQTLDH